VIHLDERLRDYVVTKQLVGCFDAALARIKSTSERPLMVHDQDLFIRQLGDILAALSTELEGYLAPQIGAGSRVTVKSGPLRGMEGWVEERYGMTTVPLRLDFIGQAAAVKMQADELELS